MYLTPTPWLYICFARHTKEAGVVQQRKFCQIALYQFVMLTIPVLIGVARRCTYIRDFQDDPLKKSLDDQSFQSRSVIGAISPIVGWAIGKDVLTRFRGIMARMVIGARNLLFLQTILEFDWYVTFSREPAMNKG